MPHPLKTVMESDDAMHPGLTDVPETMLWTLHNRAYEAERNDGCIHDPQCLEIYRSIDYDYTANFGAAEGSHGVRSMLFDEHIQAFIDEHPNAVIVNLGDGLETEQFRITAPGVLWVSVDLPEAIEIRERFITPNERRVHVAKSALDTSWFDAVPEGRPVFIAAQGLFMYFTEAQLAELLRAMARRFPGSPVMFDYIGRFLSNRTMSTKGWMRTKSYRTPPMPWGVSRREIQPLFSSWLGQDVQVRNVVYRFPRGIKSRLIPFIEEHLPALAGLFPAGVCLVELPQQG